ncbi:hypothetical protein D1007_29104 [Hordeum vulgare]|nr:hypothetical protein D1007_29104 [Hordeum vulgare]
MLNEMTQQDSVCSAALVRSSWTKNRLEIKREKIELEKHEMTMKWGLEEAKTFGKIELEKERLQLARNAEDKNILLANEILLNEHAKKWLAEKGDQPL